MPGEIELTTTDAKEMWQDIKEGIEDMETAFSLTSAMILDFHDRKGYIALGYKSMGSFLKHQGHMTETHASRLLRHAQDRKILGLLESEVEGLNEFNCRPLQRLLSVDEKIEAANIAMDMASEENDENPKLSIDHIKVAVDAVQSKRGGGTLDSIDLCIARRREFTCAVRHLGYAMADIERLAKDSRVSRYMNEVERSMNDMQTVVQMMAFAMPWARCPYCDGDGTNCKACLDHGWVNKQIFESAPKHLKSKSSQKFEELSEMPQLQDNEIIEPEPALEDL